MFPFADTSSGNIYQNHSELTAEELEMLDTFEKQRDRALENVRYRHDEPSLVLDNFLFLGNYEHATQPDTLARLNIKHIVNVCDLPPSPLVSNKFNTIHISLTDEVETNISEHFEETNKLLRDFYEKNERCMVHCAAGISRSATIVLAYLMKYHHDTLKDALVFLLEKRPIICPNSGFMLQLLQYEKRLSAKNEIEQGSVALVASKENPIQTLEEFEEHQNGKAND